MLLKIILQKNLLVEMVF